MQQIFPAEYQPQPEPIRIRTLILLRWVAIIGQLAAVSGAWLLGVRFALWPVLALIMAAAAVNLWLYLQPPSRTSPHRALVQLGFDVVQISALMALTGGLANPFALLVLAPVTIAAASLTLRLTVALGLTAMALITLAGLFALPLHDAEGVPLTLSWILALGHWLALMIGVIFFAAYAHRVTAELAATSNALFATQTALAREQRLQHLGGVVAAAAHELGTPLATIKLIAAELQDELPDRPDLQQDLVELSLSTQRCGDILRSMGRAGKDDLMLRVSPLQVVLEDAAQPHADRGPTVRIHADDIDIRRDPGVIHALRNLIQNAVDFARSEVLIQASADDSQLHVTIRDDGPGYPGALLARIGDPYLTSRRGPESRRGYEGMGLGLFIAKTLLQRSGATLEFSNGQPGAVVQVRWPLERIRADSRAALGKNPHHNA